MDKTSHGYRTDYSAHEPREWRAGDSLVEPIRARSTWVRRDDADLSSTNVSRYAGIVIRGETNPPKERFGSPTGRKACAVLAWNRADDQASRLVEYLAYLQANDRVRDSVFVVMRTIDQMLSRKEFAICRDVLRMACEKLDLLSAESLGALLAITLAAKQKLTPERELLFAAVNASYLLRYGADKTHRLLDHLR